MLEDIIAITAEYRASVTATDIILLVACLSLWSFVYYEAVLSPRGSPNGFEKSAFISNLHSVPLCVLAALSIAELTPEAVPVCWSVGFFVVDLVDSVTRRELMWTVHAVLSLVLNVATGFVPRHVVLRSRSRGFLTEASTPFLNHWKRLKSHASFCVFWMAFTACRILWVPYFLHQSYYVKLNGELDAMVYPSLAFYLLQLAWWVKMCTMLVNYKIPEKTKNGKKEE